MAGVGRGRGATVPAWLAEQQAAEAAAAAAGRPPRNGTENGSHSTGHAVQGQYDDAPPVAGERSRDRDEDRSSGHRRERSRSRDRHEGRSSRRRSRSASARRSSRSRSRRERSSSSRRSKHSSDRDRDRDRDGGGWKPRSKGSSSNFDVKPPEGTVLPGVGAASMGGALPGMMPLGNGGGTAQLQMTKHARRLYVGGVPPSMGEMEIANYFNDTITRAMLPARLDNPPVVSVYIHKDKCFAFVELSSIELATACCQLDGLTCNACNPPATLRIRRPNDYRPDQVPQGVPPPPQFNLAALGVVSTTVADGPNKVFIGGLPYHLSEEHVKELLSAFGSLKSFHLVKEAGSSTSKGYGFCEYNDVAATQTAVAGLNGMNVGDKTLTVRLNDRVPQPGGAAPMGAGGIYGYPPAPAPVNPLATLPATKVLLLKNIVTQEDLQDDAEFEEILEDVKGECSNLGLVDAVIIPRAKEGFSASAEGSVYVSYATAEMARAAALVLSERKFAGRAVLVEYYDEDAFTNRKLV